MQQVLVLGAGQLAQMMALAATPLNIRVTAIDTNNYKQPEQLEQLANLVAQADVITAEFEHIPHNILAVCQASNRLYPSAQSILIGGNRRLEKEMLQQANIANAPHTFANDASSLHSALFSLNGNAIIKTSLGGYDGKGQWRYRVGDDLNALWRDIAPSLEAQPQHLIVEQKIPFEQEVSLVGVRSKTGEVQCYDLTHNVHREGILLYSNNLKQHPLQSKAYDIFHTLVSQLDYVGVLAIEFFVHQQQLMVNEIAPRVHNSGHWTQQGCSFSQFENHIRAVCGIPLGSTQSHAYTAMVNLLGIDSLPLEVYALEGCHIHWYGKTLRPLRKMGHINLVADSEEALKQRVQKLIPYLPKDYLKPVFG